MTLVEVSLEELEKRKKKVRHPNRDFARRSVCMFLELGLECAEVDDWPDGISEPTTVEAEKRAQALRCEVFDLAVGRSVKVSRRGQHVYLIRLEGEVDD